MTTTRLCLAAAALALPATALAQTAPAATPTPAPLDRTVPTFSSLSDGQPNSPGQLSLSALGSYAQGDGNYQFGIQYTPKGKFWEDAMFWAILPSVDAGEGIADAETSATFAWQQRWLGSDTSRTTFSTSLAVQVPVDAPRQDTDVIATAMLNQLAGPGVAYLNLYVETQRGRANPAATELGAMAGYKLPLDDTVQLIGDAIYSTGANLQLEASANVNLTGKLALGPGVFVATDLNDGRGKWVAGAGVVVNYSF